MRTHKNTSRLTAKERARSTYDLIQGNATTIAQAVAMIMGALQAHAREAVDRYKRRQG